MWKFSSNAISGRMGLKAEPVKPVQSASECSDDDVSSNISRDEGLECPICYESFNMVENVPYVLWCGHTLCKNCVLGLQWAVVKFPTLPVQLPLFISCPWCHLLSFRLVYRGNLKFPRKNYFLLWMVESLNGERDRSHSFGGNHHPVWPSNNSFLRIGEATSTRRNAPHMHRDEVYQHQNHENPISSYLNMERLNASLRKSLVFFVHLTAKFPLVIVFLLIVLYVIPASAAILAVYVVLTVLFALPSFLILYFAYPILDWLVREIVT